MRFDLSVAMLNQSAVGFAMMVGGATLVVLAAAFLLWRRSASTRALAMGDEGSAKPLEAEIDAINTRRCRLLTKEVESAGDAGADGDAPSNDSLPAGALLASAVALEANRQAEEHSAPEPGLADKIDAAALIQRIVEDNAPPPPHEGALPPAIETARWRPILFRQFQPRHPGKDGLSFFGGRPIGPQHFEWPRAQGTKGGSPLTFIMQWDCSELSALDATGLLPTDGVLYCFLNLDWGSEEDYAVNHRFLHHPGPTAGWRQIEVPADARPIFGDQGAWQMSYCTPKVGDAAKHTPRTLARFPFDPIAIEYPEVELDQQEGERLFWSDGWAAEAVLAAQKSGLPDDGEIRDIERPHVPFERPFPAFPHDFGAVRTLAASVIKDLERPNRVLDKKRYPDLSDEERAAQFAQWTDEAKELYKMGCQRPLGARLEQSISDDIWAWAEARKNQLHHGFDSLVRETVNTSLGVYSEGLRVVPEAFIEEAMRGHALASEYMTHETANYAGGETFEEWQKRKEAGEVPRIRKVHAPTPAHMFGPPSFVQGDVEELIDDHILLLEISSGSGPEHHFGEGVLQYLIKPEDLAARRFDQVTSVLSAY